MGGPGGGFPEGVQGVKGELLRTGFFVLPAGKTSGKVFLKFFFKVFWPREIFLESFSEKFFENKFWRGKIFLKIKI